EERFKLQVHRETKPTQVYSLAVASNGQKLSTTVPDPRRTPGCTRAIGSGVDYSAAADCYNMTMAQLAQQLQALAPAYFSRRPNRRPHRTFGQLRFSARMADAR